MRILETAWLIILAIASISSGLNFRSCFSNSSCFSCICRLAIFFLILLFIDFYFLSWISIPKKVQISSASHSEISKPLSQQLMIVEEYPKYFANSVLVRPCSKRFSFKSALRFPISHFLNKTSLSNPNSFDRRSF